MEYLRFEDAAVEEPGAGWKRAGLLNSGRLSVDWFQKPPGHSSESHNHENEQMFVILEGEFILHTDDESVRLTANDTAWVDSWEIHYSENPGETPCSGLNIFAPGREFPYWKE